MTRPLVRVFLLLTLVGVTTVAVEPLSQQVREWEIFRVRQVLVEGNQLVSDSQVVAALALEPGSSIWDDKKEWVQRLRAHPVIREVRIRRGVPTTLNVSVEERRPVAFVPGPTLFPVDGTGQSLPLELPTLAALDLPLLPAGLPAEELTALAGEVERLLRDEPGFSALLSHLERNASGGWVAHLTSPRVEIHFQLPLTSARLRDGFRVLEDALERDPQRPPAAVDLRFADQVVLSLASRNGR
ncbi:MAG: FtsQ-type POTRA domain-containing protein [Gemmatimonadota bacterium]